MCAFLLEKYPPSAQNIISLCDQQTAAIEGLRIPKNTSFCLFPTKEQTNKHLFCFSSTELSFVAHRHKRLLRLLGLKLAVSVLSVKLDSWYSLTVLLTGYHYYWYVLISNERLQCVVDICTEVSLKDLSFGQ